MSIQDRFLAYANDFEITFEDNDYSRLEQYFTEAAIYDSGLGEAAHGLAAVMAKLEGAVDGFDRLMDTRALETAPPITEGDTVRMHWTGTYTKSGAPDLQFSGTEYAQFEGDRMCLLRTEWDPGSEEALNNWLTDHGEVLSA